MPHLSIRAKIFFSSLTFIILSCLCVGILSYTSGKNALEQAKFDQLTSLKESRKDQIEFYFEQSLGQVFTLSEDPLIVEAMSRLSEGYALIAPEDQTPELTAYYQDTFLPRLAEIGAAPDLSSVLPQGRAAHLQRLFIADNPAPVGQKDQMTRPPEESNYANAHAEYHPILRKYRAQFNYYDIFLIDAQSGDIVYSVFKETDYATNLLTGPYKDSNLAKAFISARDARTSSFTTLVDFEPYTPSYGAGASFIAAPIFEANQCIGVLAFQMPVENLDRIMTSDENWEKVGLGRTGETFIVGADHFMRSDSRFLLENKQEYLNQLRSDGVSPDILRKIDVLNTSVLLHELDAFVAEKARAGAGQSYMTDFRGNTVMTAYTPLTIEGVEWYLFAEIDRHEAFAPVNKLSRNILGAGVILILIALPLIWWISRSLTAPINRVIAVLEQLASGEANLTNRIKVEGDDEMAQLSSLFNDFVDNIADLVRQVVQNAHALRDVVSDVSEAATDIAGESESLSTRFSRNAKDAQTAGEAMAQATQVSESASQNSSSIAAATGQMNQTIGSIAQTMERSLSQTRDAVTRFHEARDLLNNLDKAAADINQVTDMIEEISEQTKLLALNANIEAVRAGHAGRGFAVVANEVKNLAKQTNDATVSIRERIQTMQEHARESLGAVEDINNVMDSLNAMMTGTSSAVEEQSVTMRDIADNTARVAETVNITRTSIEEGNGKVILLNKEMQEVQSSAAQLSSSGDFLTSAASDLAEVEAQLQELVNRFKV